MAATERNPLHHLPEYRSMTVTSNLKANKVGLGNYGVSGCAEVTRDGHSM